MANLNLEIDGKPVQVPQGSTVMDAANQAGAYVPHFCYHKKLSIAANCRMCLVQVEKAPKPLPACATPATEGMKVSTTSDYAKNAQKGVMEFLLINHPLDCPICDQGGECQLQDLAVGYGKSSSRYTEEKRVVFHKNVGPLISMEEMSRCIHCTRCVRFGQEVAGVMELGMGGRGEHSEIQSFVGRSVDSELSGNMIDVCPVGALTSKPFRYAARTWELQRKKSVSPHDGLGTNLTVQTKSNKVLRVLPFENDAINECWISDRDRFSYEAVNSEDRLTSPMVKQDGVWQQATWTQALDYIAHALKDVKSTFGADSIGMLASPTATVEELFLLNRLASAIGTPHLDARPYATDPTLDAAGGAMQTLGVSIANVAKADRILVVGAHLRHEQPLLAARIRAAVKKGCEVSFIGPLSDDPLFPVKARVVAGMDAIPAILKRIEDDGVQRKTEKPSNEKSPVAEVGASLNSGKNTMVFVGALALNAPNASAIVAAAQALSHTFGASFGRYAAAGNSVGAAAVGAVGTLAVEHAAQPPKAMLLWGLEPEFDTAAGADLAAALKDAATVIACVTHMPTGATAADVLLPIAPFTETSGTYVNCEGVAQSVQAAVRPLGDARPGWKVLRVLGELLGAKDVAFDSSEAVRDAALPAGWETRPVAGRKSAPKVLSARKTDAIARVADVPIYQSDMLVRRAVPLQKAGLSKFAQASLSADVAARIGLTAAGAVKLTQGQGTCVAQAVIDPQLPENTVRVPSAQIATAALGAQHLPLTVERA